MKWVIIKGVRYPSSVISAFAAYNMDNPFLKVRIRNKYHIVSFDDVNKMASQMVYLMNNYPDFVEIGRCYDSFFKSWYEEYEYWADNEDAIREELHHNQYEDRLYYENGDIYEHVN